MFVSIFLVQIVAVLFFFAVASAAPKPQFISGVYPSVYSSPYVPVSSVYGRAYSPYYTSSVYSGIPSVYSTYGSYSLI